MKIYEIIGRPIKVGAQKNCPAIIDEEELGSPLTPEKLRKQKDRDQKKMQKANEITRIAAVKAATVRADIGS